MTLDIEAQDVAHSWWIPALGGKFDAIPGHTNFTWFKVPEPGIYKGQCAELCGRNHADMVATVRAIEPAEFRTWLADKKAEIEAADKLAQERREQIAEEQAADANEDSPSGGQPDLAGGPSSSERNDAETP